MSLLYELVSTLYYTSICNLTAAVERFFIPTNIIMQFISMIAETDNSETGIIH